MQFIFFPEKLKLKFPCIQNLRVREYIIEKGASRKKVGITIHFGEKVSITIHFGERVSITIHFGERVSITIHFGEKS